MAKSLARVKLEQVHTVEPRALHVIDFRVLLHFVWDEASSEAEARELWLSRLQRGPDMIDFMPDRVDIVLDDSKTDLPNGMFGYWRSLVCPSYKQKRKQSKPDLVGLQPGLSYGQVRDIGYEAVSSLGLPLFSQPGFEADDWAGAVYRAKLAAKPGSLLANRQLYYSTIDSDWLQLVDDKSKQLWANVGTWTNASRLRNEAEVRWYYKHVVKYRIDKPSDIPKAKQVLGDWADNLPPGSPLSVLDLTRQHRKHRLCKAKLAELGKWLNT